MFDIYIVKQKRFNLRIEQSLDSINLCLGFIDIVLYYRKIINE